MDTPKIWQYIFRRIEEENAGSFWTVNDDEVTEFDLDISEPPLIGGIAVEAAEVSPLKQRKRRSEVGSASRRSGPW